MERVPNVGETVLLPADDELPEQRAQVLDVAQEGDLLLVDVWPCDRLAGDVDGLAEVLTAMVEEYTAEPDIQE